MTSSALERTQKEMGVALGDATPFLKIRASIRGGTSERCFDKTARIEGSNPDLAVKR